MRCFKIYKRYNSVSLIFVTYRRISKIRNWGNRNRHFVFTTSISIMLRLPGQQECVRNLFWNVTLRVLPHTNQTWLARTQLLHEKLLQKVELTTVRKPATTRFVARQVWFVSGKLNVQYHFLSTRFAVILPNITRFGCPIYRILREVRTFFFVVLPWWQMNF